MSDGANMFQGRGPSQLQDAPRGLLVNHQPRHDAPRGMPVNHPPNVHQQPSAPHALNDKPDNTDDDQFEGTLKEMEDELIKAAHVRDKAKKPGNKKKGPLPIVDAAEGAVAAPKAGKAILKRPSAEVGAAVASPKATMKRPAAEVAGAAFKKPAALVHGVDMADVFEALRNEGAKSLGAFTSKAYDTAKRRMKGYDKDTAKVFAQEQYKLAADLWRELNP